MNSARTALSLLYDVDCQFGAQGQRASMQQLDQEGPCVNQPNQSGLDVFLDAGSTPKGMLIYSGPHGSTLKQFQKFIWLFLRSFAPLTVDDCFISLSYQSLCKFRGEFYTIDRPELLFIASSTRIDKSHNLKNVFNRKETER